MLCCPICNFFFDYKEVSSPDARCPYCDHRLDTIVFPALYQQEEITKGNRADEDDARCAFHDENQADTACARCGRLICKICSIPYGKQVLCPQCLKNNLKSTDGESGRGRVAWDSLAIRLVAHPLIIFLWWATLPMAISSLIISILFYRKAPVVVSRGKWRYNTAIIVSLFWLAGWTAIIIWGIAAVAKNTSG